MTQHSAGGRSGQIGTRGAASSIPLRTANEGLNRSRISPTTKINLVETLAISEDQTFEHNLIDRLRTINISDCCVDTTDFSVKPGEPKYDELVEAGESAD